MFNAHFGHTSGYSGGIVPTFNQRKTIIIPSLLSFRNNQRVIKALPFIY